MRTLILLLCSVLVCFGQHAERRRAQQKAQQQVSGGGGGSNPWTLIGFKATATNSASTVTLNTIGATFIQVILRGYSSEVTVSEDQGNGAPNYRFADFTGGVRIRVADYINPATNLNHVFTPAGGDGGDYRSAIVLCWTGNNATPYDTSTSTNLGNMATTGIQPPGITPAQTSELALAILADQIHDTISIDSGYGIVVGTTNGVGYEFFVATNVVSSATRPTYSQNGSTANSAGMVLSTFKGQ